MSPCRSRTFPGLISALIGVGLLTLLLGACGQDSQPSKVASHDLVVEPIELKPGDAEVSYRFIDPQVGSVATAVTLDGIPEAARAQVVVYHGLHPTPPGWEHVANLTRGLPTTTVPRRGFQLQPRRVAPAEAKASRRASVTLFSTTWCGYCTKARNFLKREKILFSEYDLEKDPTARSKMAQLAKEAGVPPESLKGVPILFINGQAMAGYNEARVRKLLGR
ncbi:MAG: hypothetical protein CL940_06785 [Deltaproteobacteria bacterium]|nr:hypothetical protein [Deltaproteobacteria bacterium]